MSSLSEDGKKGLKFIPRNTAQLLGKGKWNKIFFPSAIQQMFSECKKKKKIACRERAARSFLNSLAVSFSRINFVCIIDKTFIFFLLKKTVLFFFKIVGIDERLAWVNQKNEEKRKK